ncbi:MAG: NTP transferase domain-containing protein [Desertimonas sp.]
MTPSSPPVVALVLAAGAGRRFVGAGHKLDADVGGRTILDRALGHALEAGIGPVVAVVGAPGAHRLPAGVIEVVNDRWPEGQATSLLAGIARAHDLGASAVVIGLGDQPGIEPTAWRAVAAVDEPIVVATYGGRHGHPVRLRADTWPLLPATGDSGARDVLRGHRELVTAVPCDGSPFDIDTVEDLRTWQSNSSTSSP